MQRALRAQRRHAAHGEGGRVCGGGEGGSEGGCIAGEWPLPRGPPGSLRSTPPDYVTVSTFVTFTRPWLLVCKKELQ